MRAEGVLLAISVDDSIPSDHESLQRDTAWSYETDWDFFVPFADILINMGTYPLGNHHFSFPAASKLKPYRCPDAPHRWCGVEGQILDFLEKGVNPGQLQLGISPDGCNGTHTGGGWTQAALQDFLEFCDEKGVRVLTVWTGDAFLLPTKVTTCPWFVPTLKGWVEKGSAA